MGSQHAPTCLVSSPYLQKVCTISSEVDRNASLIDSTRCLPLQDQSTPVLEGTLLPSESPLLRTNIAIESARCEVQQQPHSSNYKQSSNLTHQQTPKSAKSHRSSGWKTSKFFSKTMSSGEILRGLKKLSLTSTGFSSDPGYEIEHGKPRKSKSGQLKKRSSCGSDDAGDEDISAKTAPLGFPPLSKAKSLSEPGSTSKSSNPGIVCKKEDLKAILCTATTKKFPVVSPTKKRKQCPLRQTKSASFEPPDERRFKKEPVRRAGSEEGSSRRCSTTDDNETKKNANPCERPTVISTTSLLVDNLNSKNTQLNMNTKVVAERSSSSESYLSTVKWDECEVVDAVLIGDAIETFLKGSMSTTEKRVSFRRNSADKRAKSDG